MGKLKNCIADGSGVGRKVRRNRWGYAVRQDVPRCRRDSMLRRARRTAERRPSEDHGGSDVRGVRPRRSSWDGTDTTVRVLGHGRVGSDCHTATHLSSLRPGGSHGVASRSGRPMARPMLGTLNGRGGHAPFRRRSEGHSQRIRTPSIPCNGPTNPQRTRTLHQEPAALTLPGGIRGRQSGEDVNRGPKSQSLHSRARATGPGASAPGRRAASAARRSRP